MPSVNLPAYNVARGNSAPTSIQPPFDFDGSVVRILPLRARVDRLQSFINSYLNIVPPEVARFRVASPYVFLAFIYYGKMSLDAANFGWISQNEILFSVPLLWYRWRRGRWVFIDYASATPFIYVDDDFSMTNGREAYGWPKDHVTAERFDGTWAKNPESDRLLARFAMRTFSQLYAGKHMELRTAFEIRQHREASFLRYPFNPRAEWLPWIGIPRAIAGAFDMGRDWLEIGRALGILRRHVGMQRDFYDRSVSTLLRSIDPFGKGMWSNNINLKQFRDAEDPTKAAYQALVNSPMIWKRISRAALIGEQQILQGDSSGGVEVDIYDCPTAPIIDALGLEVEQKHSLQGESKRILRPVFPMWMQVDMAYERGRTIAWRAHKFSDVDLKDVRGPEDVSWRDPGTGRPILTRSAPEPCHYNTARGAADTELTGPYNVENATIRVMPFLAKPERLKEFLNDYLGEFLGRSGLQIAPWGRYVYLVASSYGDISSKTNDIGDWADRDVYFYVPATLRNKDGKLLRVVLVPAYGYANSATAAQTRAEVDGFPVVTATIESPSDEWMADRGPSEETMHSMLTLKTPLLPAAGTGQRIEPRVLLEVCEGDPIPAGDETAWRKIADTWGKPITQELERKKTIYATNHMQVFFGAVIANFNVFVGDWPLRLLTLKQFRDARDPMKACYQALVESELRVTHVEGNRLREIETETNLFVRIYQYPSAPIVEKLGLVHMAIETRGGVRAHVLPPVRPFWMQISFNQELGKNLLVSPRGQGEEDTRITPVGEKIEYAAETMEGDTVRLELDVEPFLSRVDPQSILEYCFYNRPDQERQAERIERTIEKNASVGESPTDFIVNELRAILEVKNSVNARPEDATNNPERLIWFRLRDLIKSRTRSFGLRHCTMGDNKQALTFRDEIAGALERDPALSKELSEFFKDSLNKQDLLSTENPWADAVKAEKSAEEDRRDLIKLLSKLSVKPCYVIRRKCIANERVRDDIFPLRDSFDLDWYQGPEVKERNASTSVIPSPSHETKSDTATPPATEPQSQTPPPTTDQSPANTPSAETAPSADPTRTRNEST